LRRTGFNECKDRTTSSLMPLLARSHSTVDLTASLSCIGQSDGMDQSARQCRSEISHRAHSAFCQNVQGRSSRLRQCLANLACRFKNRLTSIQSETKRTAIYQAKLPLQAYKHPVFPCHVLRRALDSSSRWQLHCSSHTRSSEDFAWAFAH
jgi:hypothetical protein